MEVFLTLIEHNFWLIFHIIDLKIQVEEFYRHKYTFSFHPVPPIHNLPKNLVESTLTSKKLLKNVETYSIWYG